MSKDDKRALCGERVTLDGEPATISGADLPFATVRSLDGRMFAEWAWETVQRVVTIRGGAFTL